jgi:hypothetical protein
MIGLNLERPGVVVGAMIVLRVLQEGELENSDLEEEERNLWILRIQQAAVKVTFRVTNFAACCMTTIRISGNYSHRGYRCRASVAAIQGAS